MSASAARIAGEPERDRDLAVRTGGKGLLADDVEAGSFEPLRHGLGRKAEPAMGVLLAQKLKIVRREIDDQEPSARPQHPHRLADGARAVVEEVQHLVDDDDVERIPRQRQVVDVALPHAAILQAGAIEPGARQRQHVERQIEAEPALDLGREHFQHPAGAGAEIEQRPDRFVGERRADGVFDRGVGGVQLADTVPFGRVPSEVILRGGGASGAHGGEPFAIASDDRICRIEPRNQGAGDIDAALLAEPIKGPGAFAKALDQARLGKEPQVAGQPWLRLAQDLGEVRDGQFRLGQERQNTQPRGFAGRFQRCRQPGKGQLLLIHQRFPGVVRALAHLPSHIKISLYH